VQLLEGGSIFEELAEARPPEEEEEFSSLNSVRNWKKSDMASTTTSLPSMVRPVRAPTVMTPPVLF
jgi:hypothetical protein